MNLDEVIDILGFTSMPKLSTGKLAFDPSLLPGAVQPVAPTGLSPGALAVNPSYMPAPTYVLQPSPFVASAQAPEGPSVADLNAKIAELRAAQAQPAAPQGPHVIVVPSGAAPSALSPDTVKLVMYGALGLGVVGLLFLLLKK